jgi:hypothetical protein
MPIIQATTPTNAGWAQSFDTSGVAAIAAQEKEKKDKRLQQLLVEYDTKGIWERDTDYIQNKIQEVNNFALENGTKLADPARNMKTWQEFEKMKSGVKNAVVYSMGAKEKFDKGNQKYNNSKHNMYMTDNNRDVLFGYAERPTADQYADGSAWDDPEKLFDANLDIQPQKYVDLAGTFMDEIPPTATGAVEGGKNVIESKYKMNLEKLTEGLKPIFNADTHEGSSLQKQYGGDIDAFAADVAAMTNKPSDFNLVAPRSASSTGRKLTKADMEREGAVNLIDKSEYRASETMYNEVGGVLKVRDPETNERKSAVAQFGFSTVGKVAQINADHVIKMPVTVGYSHNQGRMLDAGEGNKYTHQIVREIRDGHVANQKIEIMYSDENGKKVKNVYEKGEPLPDILKMYQDRKITKGQYDKYVLASEKERLAVVQAASDPQGYFDKAEGQKYKDTMADTKNEFLTVPYYKIKNAFEGRLKMEYGQDYDVSLGLDIEQEDATDLSVNL